jgi:hypothetical protein
MGIVVVVPSLLRPRKVLNESGAASRTPKERLREVVRVSARRTACRHTTR